MGQKQHADDGAAAQKEQFPERGLAEERRSARRGARLSAVVALAAIGMIGTAVAKSRKQAA